MKTNIDKQKVIALAKEWEEIWKDRPFDNSNGLGCQGAFALYYFLKEMDPAPELVVECGTWRGFSTWVIKMAVPNAKIICSDPILASKQFLNKAVFTPEYRIKEAEYTWQDFSNIEITIPEEKRDRAVVFFDDHQNKIPRLKQAIEKGFKHIIYDDNVPYKYTHTSFEYLFNVERDESIKECFARYEIFPPIYTAKSNNGIHLSGLLKEEDFYFRNIFNSREVYSWVSKVEVKDAFFKKETVTFDSKKNAKKIIHVCFNNMHVQPLVDILGENDFIPDVEHDIYVEHSRSIPNYDVDLSGNDNAFFFEHKKQLNDLLEKCLKENVEGIFFHGLFFDWQKELVKRIGKDKKTVWVMWGGDLYNPIKSNQPFHQLVSNVDYVATWWDKDYDIFKSFYGYKPRLQFGGSLSSEFENTDIPKRKEKLIFVGNSGDPSNNHFDILESLSSKKDISSYKIILPFAYNAPNGYKEKLCDFLIGLGLTSFEFISAMLSIREYYEWLAKAEMVVFAHQRQQAGNNVTAALYFGATVVLRKYISIEGGEVKNPIWKTWEGHANAYMVDFEKFKQGGDINTFLTNKNARDMSNVKEFASYMRGKKKTTELMKSELKVFLDAKDAEKK